MECSRRSDARTGCPRRAEESLAGPRVAGRAAGRRVRRRRHAVQPFLRLRCSRPLTPAAADGAWAGSRSQRYPSRPMAARGEHADRWNRTLASRPPDFVDRLAGHAVTRASDSDRMAYDLAFAGGPGLWQLPRRLANFPRHPQRGTYRFAMTRRAVRLPPPPPKKRARAPSRPAARHDAERARARVRAARDRPAR